MTTFANLKTKADMLTANALMDIFPISRSGVYELLRTPGFPVLHLGRRIIVPRDALIEWLDAKLKAELDQIAEVKETAEEEAAPENTTVLKAI